MSLDAAPGVWYHSTAPPTCSTPDVSDPSLVDVVLMLSAHDPSSKHEREIMTLWRYRNLCIIMVTIVKFIIIYYICR